MINEANLTPEDRKAYQQFIRFISNPQNIEWLGMLLQENPDILEYFKNFNSVTKLSKILEDEINKVCKADLKQVRTTVMTDNGNITKTTKTSTIAEALIPAITKRLESILTNFALDMKNIFGKNNSHGLLTMDLDTYKLFIDRVLEDYMEKIKKI